MFPLEMWNYYNYVVMDFPRTTNNSVEGWNHAFNISLRSYHTTIWKFITFEERTRAARGKNREN
jgi:hypothetical protein